MSVRLIYLWLVEKSNGISIELYMGVLSTVRRFFLSHSWFQGLFMGYFNSCTEQLGTYRALTWAVFRPSRRDTIKFLRYPSSVELITRLSNLLQLPTLTPIVELLSLLLINEPPHFVGGGYIMKSPLHYIIKPCFTISLHIINIIDTYDDFILRFFRC